MVPKESQKQVATVGHKDVKRTRVDHGLNRWQSLSHRKGSFLNHVFGFALHPYYSLEENKMGTV